jgi:D-3-phosphoglycerate dehydrogenase
MPKVAITDFTFPTLEFEHSILDPAGVEIVSGQCKTPESLIPLVADADAVITQFADVNADVVRAMQTAQVIVRYGIGFDNVACDVARELNIPVCNVPDYCIDEVADHTLAFILSMTRQLRANSGHMHQGNWGLGVPLDQMRALRDQTVGMIGLGRIGRTVVERLRAFKPRIVVCDPLVSVEEAVSLGCELSSLEALLAESDIVTLHCPSNDATRGMINAGSLEKMKAGSILINVGRGDLVDLDALTSALESGHIAGAALDVFDPEPPPTDSPLLAMSNVMVSSHIASASPKAARKLRETAAGLALAAINHEPLPNVVNGVEKE